MRDNEEIVRRLFNILCSYKKQPDALYGYLLQVMTGKFYDKREVVYRRDFTVKDAVFVSDGYVACYNHDDEGNRQVVGLYGKNTIIAGKSFMSRKPSLFDWAALPGAYLMTISNTRMDEVYANFPGTEELARLIVSGIAEEELARLTRLKGDAAKVITYFYNKHPTFKSPGILMTDADVASYLLINESTLRNTRAKLVREGKI